MLDIRFLLKTHYAESRALVIGVDKYERLSPLGFAVNDAVGVREALVNKLGFPSKNVISLLDQDATRENIRRAFLSFASDAVTLDDRILVFFAGHGTTRTGARGETGYLVPVDADLGDLSTLIRWDEFTSNSDLIRAKHILFVMDACYGGLALTRSLQAGSARFLKDTMLRYSRQVLTAGKANETVADSGDPLPGHSVFTGHFLEGLHGSAATPEGIITGSGGSENIVEAEGQRTLLLETRMFPDPQVAQDTTEAPPYARHGQQAWDDRKRRVEAEGPKRRVREHYCLKRECSLTLKIAQDW